MPIDVSNNETWTILKSACKCGDDEHTITIWIEHEEETMVTELIMKNYLGFCDIINPPKWLPTKLWFVCDIFEFFKRMKFYFKTSFKLFTEGYLEMTGDFIFRDKEQLDSFVTEIKKASERVGANYSRIKELETELATLKKGKI